MRVIKDLSAEIKGTNAHYFKLNELSEENADSVLLYGYNVLRNPKIHEEIRLYKRKSYFNVTMPTEYFGADPTLRDAAFDAIYGICPYSTRWLNEITSSGKYKPTFYPFNDNDIPSRKEKIYDVCYHGGLHGEMWVECLNILKKFNYRYMSMTKRINTLTRRNLHLTTNRNLTNNGKLNLIAKCKISVCYNTLQLTGPPQVANVKKRNQWYKNEAFKYIEKLGIAPQFKSRFNEAAMCRTLNLVKRDPWNIAENYYVPDIDFVYFDSNDELEEKIRSILNNWEAYLPIVDSAYKTSMGYTTKKLYNIIKNGREV